MWLRARERSVQLPALRAGVDVLMEESLTHVHAFKAVKTSRLLCVLVAMSAALWAPRVLAHHSFAAEYDANKPVTLKGTVSKVEWTNPHARFYVDVKDDKAR